MPASAVLAPVVALPSARPESVRLVRGGRACPACAERVCADAGACAADLATRSWANCQDCGGSGYDTTGFDIWCPVCVGSGTVEV